MDAKKIFNIFGFLFLLISVPLGVILVLQKTDFLNKAFGTPANIIVDAGSSFDVKGGVWRNLGQGGEERARMLSSVTGQVASLRPEYIRIDHIYDNFDLVSKDSAGNINFNWTKLDETVSDIRATGALPFFSLSYMPPSISRGGDVTDIPSNWGDWQVVVQRTIEHYSGRNGMNLSNVYYEVWNEPDLFGGFKTYGEKNYLDLYLNAAIGAGRASNVNSFKFGGPASTDLYKGWFDALLKFASQNNLRLDFFSWHKYSNNLDDYEKQINDFNSWLGNHPNYQNLEMMITEIGIDSKNNKAYDGNLSAIHTIATAAILESNISKMFTFEIKDGPGPEKLWGRWGILTHDKYGAPETKPRYSAIAFLNKMIGKKVNVAGNGSWVKAFAKEDRGVIKILVVNYDTSGKHTEAVPINVSNIPYQDFNIKRTDFLGGTSNIPVLSSGGSWGVVEEFPPNTATIYEIMPK